MYRAPLLSYILAHLVNDKITPQNQLVYNEREVPPGRGRTGLVLGLPKRGCYPHLGLTPGDEGLVRFEEPKKFGEGS